MTPSFNADEVLAMAEQIERNGRIFYRDAAGFAGSGKTKQLLLDLSEWEENHESLVMKIRAGLTDEQRALSLFDANSESELFLRAMADTRIFKAGTDVSMLMKEFESSRGVLEYAIQMERDSILFYFGLLGAVPPEFGKLSIDDLIKEEIGHVARLKEALTDPDGPGTAASGLQA